VRACTRAGADAGAQARARAGACRRVRVNDDHATAVP